MRLKKVQVATSLDVCWGKYMFIRLLPGKLGSYEVSSFVTDCKLARTHNVVLTITITKYPLYGLIKLKFSDKLESVAKLN